MKIKEAIQITGSIGYPSKMPGTSYGISATKCITGGKLQAVEGSTCHKCYAMQGNYIYDSVKQAHEKRLSGIYNPAWPAAMARMLKAAHSQTIKNPLPPFHRWHDSGDLQSVQHLAAICEVARLTPYLSHWLPTRELTTVLNFIKGGGTIPDNLIIRASATMIDQAPTARWPFTSTVHATKPAQGWSCPSLQQDGKCGACRKCWDKTIPNVSYHIH